MKKVKNIVSIMLLVLLATGCGSGGSSDRPSITCTMDSSYGDIKLKAIADSPEDVVDELISTTEVKYELLGFTKEDLDDERKKEIEKFANSDFQGGKVELEYGEESFTIVVRTTEIEDGYKVPLKDIPQVLAGFECK